MVEAAQLSTADAARPSSFGFQFRYYLALTWATVTLRRDCWWERHVPFKVRHGIYWAFAVGLVVWAATNWNPLGSVGDAPRHRNWDSFAFWLIAGVVVFLAVVGLVLTIRELDRVGWKRTVSRSVVLIAFALGVAAVTLYQAQRMGVHIQSCAMVGKHEHCGRYASYASERHVFGMLAWQGANVMPVLDIPKSTGWSRPARSSDPIVVAIILLVRLWVAIGLLAVIKRLWDKWSAGPSSQPPPAWTPWRPWPRPPSSP